MAKAQHKKIELIVERRALVGRKVKHLRADGILPAVLYGKGQDSLSLQVSLKDFERVLKEAGESTLVYVRVGDQAYPTIINEVARNRMSGQPIHADFYNVRLDEKITAMVPVVFIGESPAVKNLSAIFVRNINELEVEALPANLPHELEVDISTLENFGDTVTVRDIKMSDAVLTADADDILASVKEPISEEELEAELAAPTADVSAVEEIKKEPKPGEDATEEGEALAPAPAE